RAVAPCSVRAMTRDKREADQAAQPVVVLDKSRFFWLALPSPIPGMRVAPHSPPRAAPVQEAIAALANRVSLSEQQTSEVFGCVMRGEATPAQIAALLMVLRLKG